MSETLSQALAAEAATFTYDGLPPEVVQKGKKLILHALGGCLAGTFSAPSLMMDSLARELGGSTDCTIFGSGTKASLLNATLANVSKCSGFVDKSYGTPEARFHFGGQSQMIPPLISLGERQRASGRDVMTAIVTAYEMANKLYGSFGGNFGLLDNGWYTDSIGRPAALALSAGRLLGLSEEQTAHAVAMAAAFTLVPFIIYSPHARHSPELRTSVALTQAMQSTLLAWKGFTGPLDVFEGKYGLAEVATNGTMDLEFVRRPRQDWTILYTGINTFAGDSDMAGFSEASASLARDYDIQAEDIEKVVVKTTAREARRLGNPAATHLRRPTTREWARHSCFYVTAVSIIYRGKDHDQFTDERVLNADPRVYTLMDRVSVESDTRYEGYNMRGSAEITMKNGEVYQREVLEPHGLHPRSPLTNAENEELFRSRAGAVISEKQMSKIIDTVYNIETLDDIAALTQLLVVPQD